MVTSVSTAVIQITPCAHKAIAINMIYVSNNLKFKKLGMKCFSMKTSYFIWYMYVVVKHLRGVRYFGMTNSVGQ